MKKIKVAITMVIMMAIISVTPVIAFATCDEQNIGIRNVDKEMSLTKESEYLVQWSASTTIYYVIAETLNVRAGAGEDYAIIGILSHNDMVPVLSISNGWAKITFNTKIGYVEAEYLVML